MIERIILSEAIKDSNVIESIRSNMPVATREKAGLADNNILKAFKSVSLNLTIGQPYTIGKVAGFLLIRCTVKHHAPFTYWCSNYNQTVDLLYKGDFPYDLPTGFTLEWSGEMNSYNNELKIETVGSNGYFTILWQEA